MRLPISTRHAVIAVAAEVCGSGVRVDVANESQLVQFIDATERQHGPIDLFCSNAGVALGGGLETSNEIWSKVMDINVMAHVYAARALVPRMIARGGGYLLNTASAAGLLTQIGNVTYSVSKHAAVAFAEWLSITYGAQGLKVSLLCPQAVRTNHDCRTRKRLCERQWHHRTRGRRRRSRARTGGRDDIDPAAPGGRRLRQPSRTGS